MATRLGFLVNLLRALVWIGIALLVLLPGWRWFDPAVEPDPFRRAGLWLVAASPHLICAFGLGQLLVFCARLREGAVFTALAACAIRRMGMATVAACLILAPSRWLTAPDGAFPVNATIMIAVVGGTLGIVFIVFAAVLDEARRLAEENAGFV